MKNKLIKILKRALRTLKKERRDTQTQVVKNGKKYNRRDNKKIIQKELKDY